MWRVSCFISHIKWKLYLRKCEKLRNFTDDDLKPGVKIEWYKGISTIVELSTDFSMTVITGKEPVSFQPSISYVLDTNYYFEDEPDRIYDTSEILRIVEDK